MNNPFFIFLVIVFTIIFVFLINLVIKGFKKPNDKKDGDTKPNLRHKK